jgi:hypothetical protein
MSFPNSINAKLQNFENSSKKTIENLSVFPNPVENGIIYISIKYDLPKTIEIYDVLGKRIIATTIKNKALDISRLAPGIYILKIKVKELSATRKLVVR